MSTPLEVIRISQKKFDDQVSLLDSEGELSDFGYKLQEGNSVWTITDWGHIKAFQNTQTLALLQALHDELEGKKWIKAEVIASVSKNIDNRQNMYMEYHNEAIQDQQDNLQALMDSIRV